jgi:acyl-CoA synthetase (AMP-forming)/AMP-acid ligase II
MIKSSGYRVSPSEVEEIIYSSKQISEVAVMGVPHPTLGQAIIAVVNPGGNLECDPNTVIALCKRELPNFMVPTQIEIISPLPKNPNGKVDRSLLKKKYENLFE